MMPHDYFYLECHGSMQNGDFGWTGEPVNRWTGELVNWWTSEPVGVYVGELVNCKHSYILGGELLNFSDLSLSF